MKPLLRPGASLLVLSALLTISQSAYINSECNSNETETLVTTTRRVTIGSGQPCNFSIENRTSENGGISGLIPGTVYEVFFYCLNCSKEVTTKPEAISNPNITNITPSSLSLAWTEPEGERSFFKVQWTDGNHSVTVNTTSTSETITNLTAGVKYNIAVSAVALDGHTEGEKGFVSNYTYPEAVRNLSVTEVTTSSLFVSWTKPEGQSSSYRVQWTDGNVSGDGNVFQTFENITNLTAGVQYTATVTAVAGDGLTEGHSATVSQYTKPEAVRNVTVSNITTSSISLSWTEPVGQSSFYRVLWSRGDFSDSAHVNQTHINISNLTAGVQYTVSVTAVAHDGFTKAQNASVTQYTRPGKVREHTVHTNTSSISLNWTSPPGEVAMYLVEWSNGSVVTNQTYTDPFAVLSGLIPGTTYTISVIALVGDGLRGEPYTFTSVTKPAAVSSLAIVDFTTSSLNLSWNEPEGKATSYTIQWAVGGVNFSTGTTDTFFTIKDLSPGTKYNISVAAVAVDSSNEGERTFITTFTRPEKPGNVILTAQGTYHLNICWTLPKGSFERYVVNISNKELNYFFSDVTTVNKANFTNLDPGRIFVVTVTAVAGNFRKTSEEASFATYPTPPGPIVISLQTNSSFHVNWATPAQMDGAPNIRFFVTYQSDTGDILKVNTTVNNAQLAQLFPGTIYNVSVETAGPQNLRSTAVHNSASTLPNPVLNLVAVPKTTASVEVTWSYPQGSKEKYEYLVQIHNATGSLFNKTVEGNRTVLTNLDPGTRYNISVTTITRTRSESNEELTYSYTMPKAVTGLVVENVNTTSIRLSWTRQSDYKSSYSYLVMAWQDAVIVQNDSTDVEMYTFFHLTPGALYRFDVFTSVDGVISISESISSYTSPAAVSGLTVVGCVTDLAVTWSLASGQVDSYSVLLFRDNQQEKTDMDLSNKTDSKKFRGLKPGVIYCVVLVTKTGTTETNSSSVCNATLPSPPGNITVVSQTVHSINFTWPFPEDMDHQQYNFSVFTFNGSFVTENNWFVLDNLQSGSQYNISVVAVGVFSYESTRVIAENYTRPFPVTNLRQTNDTTDAVTLVWEQREEKTHYSYVVQLSGGTVFKRNKVLLTTDTIPGLVAGSNYSCNVTTQTADGTQADPVLVSCFTLPETVQPSVSSQGSNSSLLVSWSKPPGNVAYYTVHINSTTTVDERVISPTSASFLFENLSPGIIYSARVTTNSGFSNASSGFVSNATFPNPPGPIDILSKTTTSINVRWQAAPLMTNGSFAYRLTITPPKRQEDIPGHSTSHVFDSLLPGTQYNMSVSTVGAMDFESKPVEIHMVTTRPFSVNNLSTSTEEESIAVTWVDRYFKESYSYNVTWQSSDKADSVAANHTMYNITHLVPGTRYNISVTTETSDGTQGASKWISNCTGASPVKNLQCEGPNKTNAEVVLAWSSPNGRYDGFLVTVIGDKMLSQRSPCCNHTVSNLLHYTVYNLTVDTQSCGAPSYSVFLECRTGITNPPIAEVNESLVVAHQNGDNKFTLQIDSRLLNDSNGPVTHVGVLVSRDLPGNVSNWRSYLGNTYDQWTGKDTPVYLATVTQDIKQVRSVKSFLTIEVGDDSRWEGYRNGALVPGEKYQYAVVVFTSLSLQNDLVNGEMSLVSTTSFFPPLTLTVNPVTGIAVGATLGVFFVLFIILMGFIFYWRRASSKEQTDIQIHSMRAKVSVAVRMEDYEVYYRKQKADSNCGFAEEFEDLKPVGTVQSKTHALSLENKPKNRYNNVLPYDSSRVKLSIIHGSPYDDYINANYIPGYNSRKEFIAAQGPLPATVKDFWRMIWEKNVQTVVMLTRCNEQGRVKCEQYWDFGTKHFENITVTTTSDIPLEDWTIRDFNIKNVKTAETRSVRQFHFTAWPDHGVPETTELLISFRHLVREHMEQYSKHSPTVVHCSAGVGRTGTFIAIDRLIFQIERENVVDVYGIVHDLRMHRPLMVQTEDQYVFLNQCAMDIIRSRTGTNVDLIYQNTAALSIYENVEPKKGYRRYNDA